MGREERIGRAMAEGEFERTTGPLRPYNSTYKCDKCGLPFTPIENVGMVGMPTIRPETVWCSGKNMLDTSNRVQCPLIGQHLHKRCPACGFVWNEHTYDHEEEVP